MNNVTLEDHTQVCRSKDQVSSKLQDEAVILNIKAGKYYNLNPVGNRIWELMDQPVTVLAICETILDEFDVDRQRCEADTRNILMNLVDAGLVDIGAAES